MDQITGFFVAEDVDYLPHTHISPTLAWGRDMEENRDYEVHNDDQDLTKVIRREGSRLPKDFWVRVVFDADGSTQSGSFRFRGEDEFFTLPGGATITSVKSLLSPPLTIGSDFDYDPELGAIFYEPMGRVVTGDRIEFTYPLPIQKTPEMVKAKPFTLDPGDNELTLDVDLPIWNVWVTDSDGVSISSLEIQVDYRGGVVSVPTILPQEVTVNFYSTGIYPYATVLDFNRTYENPGVTQKNNTAVWSALQRATQRIEGIFHKFRRESPIAPLPSEWVFLQTYVLQLARVYLKLCRDQDEVDAIMRELKNLEEIIGSGDHLTGVPRAKRGPHYIPGTIDPLPKFWRPR